MEEFQICSSLSQHKMNDNQKKPDLGEEGIEDMVNLPDLNETTLLWNVKQRYEKEIIYTFTGSILVSVNPYKMYDIYGLDAVKKYEGQILGTLPPHLFAIASSAYSKMTKDNEDQVVVICGESGAGKTENTKLFMQYLAAVNKSPSNIITEQILEATPLLESFGNAKTVKNNNSSRFGKYLEIHFKDGIITGAKTTEYLLEKSRISNQAPDERNYHVFYELLAGLTEEEKEKYGLQTADKYFYLNQGGPTEIDGKNDGEDFRFLLAAMQVLGFTNEEQDTIFRILASVLHLGNIFFHRKQLLHGQEGVEVGSDAEIRWVSHLLQLSLDGIFKALTVKTTEARNERLITPLNIDQALDARDAISKALYASLFSWLVQRVNLMVYKGAKKTTIAILDIFGFEDFKENSFEQLCINYANETLQAYFNKFVFKIEQQEYAKEKIDWQTLSYPDNQHVLNLISKKPIGILPLLDDESNFPRASDQSFLEKCHYNHALNELYSRPRMSSMEFGIKHYAGQVWYSVDGFLEKNRDTLRSNVIDLLINSRMPMISRMFQNLRDFCESNKTYSRSDGRFITMKPRAPTVSAGFQDSLQCLIEIMSKCNPWFVRCIKPNTEKAPMKFDIPVVLEQLRYSGMLETIRIRKIGYPIRMKFQHFVARYRCLLTGKSLRGTSSKETCKIILNKNSQYSAQYQLGSTKIFLRESLENLLEKERMSVMKVSAIHIQRHVRGFLARRRYMAMRSSIIKIQSFYRAYRCRKDYKKIIKGVIKLQAIFRMVKQKREYEKIKELHNRQREADRAAIERAREKAAREELERTRAVAGVNHLEIPAELAYIFGKIDEWQCPHGNQNIARMSTPIKVPRQRLLLPNDIDYHAFTKFTNIYFRAHIWGMKREPIKTPFLAKNNESDFQESLAIFKLILRFMNDNNLSGKKEKILEDYIIQKGLSNPNLRDEILCQLCNQTWKNENMANNERGWQLLTNCLRCFAPSPTLYKYILKYVSDHGLEGYKAVAQQLLLRSEKVEPQNVRTYPPTQLEWKANVKKCKMSLDATFPDGDSKHASIDSWTTGESFASELLRSKGISKSFGWTVELDDEGDIFELNGNDYVLDLISEIEVHPNFPVNKSFFLVSANKTKSRVHKKSHHNPEKINKYLFDCEESVPVPTVRNYQSRMEQNKLHKYAPNGDYRGRSLSSDNIIEREYSESLSNKSLNFDPAAETNIGLSKRSKLNERYLNKKSAIEKLKLSETSKLNQRYVQANTTQEDKLSELYKSEDILNQGFEEDQSQLSNKRSKSMQELGLATSALNDRYFSRPNLQKTTSLVGGSAQLIDNGSVLSKLSEVPDELSGLVTSKISSRPLPAEPEEIEMSRSSRNHPHHVIRPSSRSSSSSISSNASNDYPVISRSHNELHKDKILSGSGDPLLAGRSYEPSSRYKKYNPSQAVQLPARHPPYLHNTKAYLDRSVSRDGDYGKAMSDTSESPSLASHVKNIRIPSHTSDLDQYLDDLFNPVLDANIDELSDARSLAASIKGGPSSRIDKYDVLQYRLVQRSIDQDSVLDDLQVFDFEHLSQPDKLSSKLKGGAHKDVKTSQRQSPNDSESFTEDQQQAHSNMPLMNIAGMTVPLVDTSQLIQQQVLHQQMIQMQQRAFLASAVQQNLEMQKQLLQQNQQLQQLLVQSSVASPSESPNTYSQLLQMSPSPLLSQSHLDNLGLSLPSPNIKTPSPSPNLDASGLLSLSKGLHDIQLTQNNTNQSIPLPPPPPPLPPSTPVDVYGRVKTVRIGKKYRWPPPVEKNEQQSFFEFKMKKQQEKSDKTGDDGQNQSVDFPEISNMNNDAIGYREQTQTIETKSNATQDVFNKFNQKSKPENIIKITSKAPPGSIGKLRISSEMKAKLEQLTIDQSVRSKKDPKERKTVQSRSMDDISNSGVKKLSEQRKLLLEQQLMGSLRTNDLLEQNTPSLKGRGQNSVDDLQKIHKLQQSNSRSAQSGVISANYELAHVENGMKNQTDNKSRKSGSRESRERRDELGPYNRMSGTITSTVNAECGDRMSHSSVPGHYFDDTSTINSLAYQDSIASSATHQQGFSSHGSDSNLPKQIKRMSVPPPPPPTNGSGSHHMNPTYQSMPQLNQSGPSSVALSSSFYAPSSPVIIRHHRNLHSLMQPSLSFDRIELEESNEFLNPIDAPPPAVISGRSEDYSVKTKLFELVDSQILTYSKVAWKLRLRKEIFSPSETIDNPLMLHLIFCQIVQDAYSTNCIRLSSEEKLKLQSQLKIHGVNCNNIFSSSPKLSLQRSIIELAKEFPTYFCRLYPISGGRNLPNVDLLGVSHSGVRLIKRERDAICDYLRVLDVLRLDDILEVLVPKKFTLQIILAGGGWITLFSPKANLIKQLIDAFTYEAQRNEVEFVRSVKDQLSKEPSLLEFRKDNVIRIIKNKNLQIAKGWLFGVLESGESGLFPCDYVVPLSKQELAKMNQRTDGVRGMQNGHAPNYMNNTQELVKDHLKETNSFICSEHSCQDDSSLLWVESKNDQIDDAKSDLTQASQLADGKFSLLQFALFNFRESLEKYDLSIKEGSIRGSIKLIENIKAKKKGKKNKNDPSSDWTWRELSDLVKFTKTPIQASLLKLASQELNKLAVECFIAIMRYMGDYQMMKNQTEVDCVYTILLNCHKYPQLRDEVYCQIMKQTTTNKSSRPDSCQRGWRLFSIVAAYFDCSDMLKPYLFKYLETAAYDKRRAYHATASVCLKNLRKTFKFGGRKNVPSIEEIAAISAGRNSRRQIYRLPGGTERIINTKSTTVVSDIIEEICIMLNVRNPVEMEEFSLYCIIEGDPYTMPLNIDEYILDVTTELLKNGQVFYLIFCRSVWFYPLRLDSQLYIEVIFNQVAPDYLEGLLLIIPEEKLPEDTIPQIARIAALLHRAADMNHMPTKDEVKYLLPKPVLPMRDLRPPQWVEMVQNNWGDMSALTTTEAKAQCLDILQKWSLFGSCFFAVKRIQNDTSSHPDNILALNKDGVHFLDIITHETIWKYPFNEVISTRKVRAEDGTLFLDMKCGNLMVQKITRIQTDQAHEISRLIRQYIEIEQRSRNAKKDAPQDQVLSRSSTSIVEH